MVRPRLDRTVLFNPNVTYFKPQGIPLRDLEEVILPVDEYEAVRLKDLERLEQEECAEKMDISQPTFHRLVVSARKKIADAIVNGKAIKIEGGAYKMVQARVRMGRGMGFGGSAMNCVCPKCGYKEPKVMGVPCVDKNCPKCNIPMIRGD